MPVNRHSITLMNSSGTEMNKYSDEVKGDSYYGYTDGLHTVQVTYNQFVGRLRIQATLSLDPSDDEWFDILPETTAGTAFNPDGYVQFTSAAPANISEAYTFKGNFTLIRIYMDRTHVGDGTTYDSSYGQISRIILSS